MGGPQLTADDHGASGYRNVLNGVARGGLTVAVVVGVVDDPGITVDGGDDRAVVVGVVISHGVVTHGVLGPGVRATVEDSHGQLLRQGQLNHADQAVGGRAVLGAALEQILGQSSARIRTVNGNGGGVGLDRAVQRGGGSRHEGHADTHQHSQAKQDGEDFCGKLHDDILSCV